MRNECRSESVGTVWVELGLNWVKTGQMWVKSGSHRSPWSSQMGHVGIVGHWASKMRGVAFGATEFCGQVFWATGLNNGCLGL